MFFPIKSSWIAPLQKSKLVTIIKSSGMFQAVVMEYMHSQQMFIIKLNFFTRQSLDAILELVTVSVDSFRQRLCCFSSIVFRAVNTLSMIDNISCGAGAICSRYFWFVFAFDMGFPWHHLARNTFRALTGNSWTFRLPQGNVLGFYQYIAQRRSCLFHKTELKICSVFLFHIFEDFNKFLISAKSGNDSDLLISLWALLGFFKASFFNFNLI